MGRSSLAQKDVGSVTPSTKNTLLYQKLKCQIQKQQHLGLETLRGLLNCEEEIRSDKLRFITSSKKAKKEVFLSNLD